MRTEANKAVVRRAFDAWNRGDIEGFVACYAKDLEVHPTAWAADPVTVDPALHAHSVQAWFAGFSDLRMEYREMVAEGDRVFVRFVCSGTHDGRWQGIAPTGRRVVFEEWHLLRVENGRITEETSLLDELTLLSRIGAVARR